MRIHPRFVAAVLGCLVVGCGGLDDESPAGGESSCPVPVGARARVEAIVTTSVASASWITSNSHGHGALAGRGFGTAVPLTTMAALYSATLAEACTAPKTLDPYCEEPEGAGASSRCSQLACEAAGKGSAKVWFEGLPATTPADPPPGDATVRSVQHTVRYEEIDTDGLELRWDGEIDVSLEDGFSATWEPAGAASIVAFEASSTTLSDEIVGIAPEAIVFDLEIGEEGPAGELLYRTAAIASVTAAGVAWTGACAP